MPPAAVLRVLVQAAGIAETNRALMSVHATLEKVQKRLAEFGAARATATATVDASGVDRHVTEATEKVRAFGALTAEARADLKISGATAQIEQLETRLAQLAAKDPTVEVRVQTAKALADLERVEAKHRELVAAHAPVVVDVDTNRARQQLAQVEQQSKRTRGALAGVGDGGRAGSAGLIAMRGSIGPLSGGLGALSSVALFLAVALVGIIGPAFALAVALAPLAGLLAAAGAGAVAGAQGFGVFKLATMGVLDALKEQTKNQQQAGAGAIKHAGQEQSAARAIASAQEAVKAAREGVADALRRQAEAEHTEHAAIAALPAAYQEARRTLADLRSTVIDTAIALGQAVLAAIDASTALADLLNGPSPRELADAHRAVTDALRGEAGAARELTRAQQALNDLMAPPAVLDVADAQDAVADALRGQQHAAMDLADQIVATNAVMANPASTADEQARAQLALADAQNAVGDAARRTEHAQQALERLQAPASADAVAEAQGRIADAQAAVTAATQGTADARANLATLQAGPSDLEIARARLAVAAAEQSVSSAVTDASRAAADYSAAQTAGLRGSTAVVAAREAIRSATLATADADRELVRAHHQVERALQGVTDAQQSASTAMAGTAATAGNLNTKFDSLPASAQHFVRVLQSMTDKATGLRTVAADGFFPGAEAGLQSAARNFEPVRRVVAATSSVLGDLARRAGELVGSKAFGRDIETIGTSNARVIDNLGGAALHLISALRQVLVVVGPLTEDLSRGAEAWSLNTAEAAKSGRESGKMAAFFERTREVLGRVLSIVGHVTHGLFGMGKAGSDSGDSILASIDRAAKRFDAWANSTGGQEALKSFFRDTRKLAAAMLPAIGGLAQGFGVLTLRLLPVATVLKLLGPYADEAVIAFLSYKLTLTAVAIAQGTMTAATTAWGVAVTIATQLSRAHTIGLRLMLTAMAQNLAYTVLWRTAALASATATGVATAAQWLLNAAMTANPIGLVIVAVAALIAIFVALGGNLGDVGDAFDRLWDVIKAGASAVLGWLSDHWPTVLAILGGPIGLAVLLIVRNWDTIKNATTSVWNAILGFLTGIWGTIRSTATTVWEAIKVAVMTPLYFVRDTVSGVVSAIASHLASGWDTIKASASSAWIAVRDFILSPVRAARDAIPDIVSAIGSKIGDGWDAIKSTAGKFASGLKDTVMDGFKGAVNGVIGFVNHIIDAINAIPAVPNIGHIDKLATGGVVGAAGIGASGARAAVGMAHGGAFARTNGIVDHPITLMGEEAPRHPEIVVPTNPAYRPRAQQLALMAMGAVGLAEGGVVSAFRTAIDRTNANPKPSLALWEAGIVESGLRNLPYGDADSRGALQVRDQTARGMGINNMDPLAVAMAFLTRGFWKYPGGAIGIAARNPGHTAGWVAQGTQGSAYPDRYDAVRDQASKYLKGGDGGGGILDAIGGAVSSVGGVLGHLLESGAGFILDKLPGVGDLPDWLHPTGKYALSKVGDWIKDKVNGLIGADDGGGSGGAGIHKNTRAIAEQVARATGLLLGSNFRNPSHNAAVGGVVNSLHTHGTPANPGAWDLNGPPASLYAGQDYAREHFPDLMENLVHDVGSGLHLHLGFFAQGGQYGSGLFGSFEDGTDYVPRTGPYLLHQGEAVTPAGAGLTAEDLIEAVRQGLSELDVQLVIDGEVIDARVEIVVDRKSRRTRNAYKAGAQL